MNVSRGVRSFLFNKTAFPLVELALHREQKPKRTDVIITMKFIYFILFCVFLPANGTLSCEESDSNINMWLGVFIIGMILNGIGGTTLYSVGIVFLDNSVSPRTFPLYQGRV